MGSNPELCAANCTLFVPKGVEKLEVNEKNDDHLCVFYDENDCKFEFTYNDNDINNIKVIAKEKLECPTEVFILGIVMGVIASIVLLGLALLFLWKILTTIHDRREFAKFEKERQAAKWDTVSWNSGKLTGSSAFTFAHALWTYALIVIFGQFSIIPGRESDLQTSNVHFQKSNLHRSQSQHVNHCKQRTTPIPLNGTEWGKRSAKRESSDLFSSAERIFEYYLFSAEGMVLQKSEN